MEMSEVRPLVRPSVQDMYQFISNLHTSIILGISSLSSNLGKIRKKNLRCLPKHIKISKCYNFNEN